MFILVGFLLYLVGILQVLIVEFVKFKILEMLNFQLCFLDFVMELLNLL